jgi:hypothetical protein
MRPHHRHPRDRDRHARDRDSHARDRDRDRDRGAVQRRTMQTSPDSRANPVRVGS